MALLNNDFLISQGLGFKITGALPIDIRQVVQHVSDLTANDTWLDNVYHGLLVSVVDNHGVYMFCPSNDMDFDTSKPENWKCISSTQSEITGVNIEQYPAFYVDEEDNLSYVVYRDGDVWKRFSDNVVVEDSLIIEEPRYTETTGTIGTNPERGIAIDPYEHSEVNADGTYIKSKDADGVITYSKIDLSAIEKQINDLSTNLHQEIVDLSTNVDNLSTNLHQEIVDLSTNVDAAIENVNTKVDALSKAFILRGNAEYNPNVTDPKNIEFLVDEEEGQPFTSLRPGDVYQTPDTKEWAVAEDENEDLFWIELGFNISQNTIETSTNSSFVKVSTQYDSSTATTTIFVDVSTSTLDTSIGYTPTGFVTDAQLKTQFEWVCLD